MKNKYVKNLTLSAMSLALGIVLPILTGQIPQIGRMLLPMHIPIFLCAFICGWQYGMSVAVILPLFRSLVFGVPVMYPDAIAIAFEMATYAFVAGFIYSRVKRQSLWKIYLCLTLAMISGRIVRTVVQLSLLGIAGTPFSFGAFFTGVIAAGVPGIILQLILIPLVILTLDKAKVIPFKGI